MNLVYIRHKHISRNNPKVAFYNRKYNQEITFRLNEALCDSRLNIYCKSFLRYLSAHITNGRTGIRCDGQTWVYATRDILAKELTCCVRTVSNVIRRLTDLGYIARACHSYADTRYYTFAGISLASRTENKKNTLPLHETPTSIKDNIIILPSVSNNNIITKDNDSEVGSEVAEKIPFPNPRVDDFSGDGSTRAIPEDMLLIYNALFLCTAVMTPALFDRLNIVYRYKIFSLKRWSDYLKTVRSNNIIDPNGHLFYLLRNESLIDFLAMKKDKKTDKKPINKFAVNDNSVIFENILNRANDPRIQSILTKFKTKYGIDKVIKHFQYTLFKFIGFSSYAPPHLDITFIKSSQLEEFITDSDVISFRVWLSKEYHVDYGYIKFCN